jgi:hypothetical protein
LRKRLTAFFDVTIKIVTVTRGLAVLERAFGDEARLRKIAVGTVKLVLGEKSMKG